MTTPPVSFSGPLSNAWSRMTASLFSPIDVKKWFVLGFTAWLAGLADSCGSGASWTGDWDSRDFENFGNGFGESWEAWEAWFAGGLFASLAAIGCLIVLVLALAVVFVSSRGKFVFLDNVISDRFLVVDPWKRFQRQGNSLFFFRILFGIACIVLIGGAVLTVAATIGLSFWSELNTFASIGVALAASCVLAVLVLGTIYATFFLDAFVVPLMHRYDLGVIDGWRRFLALFGARPLPFLLVGLMVLGLGICLGIVVVVFGIATCCLGFVLLAIPYLGSVVFLPVSVLYRGFTVDFLAQFDGELLPGAGDPTV